MNVLIPHEALTRIQIEYVETPGLKLTSDQIAPLCHLQKDVCEVALRLLTDAGFLLRANDGSFQRKPFQATAALENG
jgi:hypothetical protein